MKPFLSIPGILILTTMLSACQPGASSPPPPPPAEDIIVLDLAAWMSRQTYGYAVFVNPSIIKTIKVGDDHLAMNVTATWNVAQPNLNARGSLDFPIRRTLVSHGVRQGFTLIYRLDPANRWVLDGVTLTLFDPTLLVKTPDYTKKVDEQ